MRAVILMMIIVKFIMIIKLKVITIIIKSWCGVVVVMVMSLQASSQSVGIGRAAHYHLPTTAAFDCVLVIANQLG